jgi:hypothetical protein
MASIRKRNGKFQARIHRLGVGFISKTFLTHGDALGWAGQGRRRSTQSASRWGRAATH